VGLYAFVETDLPADAVERLARPAPDLVQPVARLPRHPDGTPRLDALQLVATNRLDELATLQATDPDLTATLAPIVAQRLNLTDRVLR
jgi:hypothetical protein